MPPRFRDAVAEMVCSRQMQLAVAIGIFSVLALMMGVSLRVAEPGSASYTLAALNIATLLLLIVVCVLVILLCRR